MTRQINSTAASTTQTDRYIVLGDARRVEDDGTDLVNSIIVTSETKPTEL